MASPPTAVVKTVPAPPEPAAVPPVKPVQSIAPSASVSTAASSAALPPPLKTPPSLPSDAQLPPAALQDGPKTGSSHPPSAPVKAPPPFVLPKPQSPVNVVSPMTQNATALPPSTTPVKPAVASVPTYAPAARVTPTPVSFSPPVLQSSSMSPFGDGVSTPTRSTPSGRATPSAALRQGVPQKPYTFLEEKAR